MGGTNPYKGGALGGVAKLRLSKVSWVLLAPLPLGPLPSLALRLLPLTPPWPHLPVLLLDTANRLDADDLNLNSN